mgnify:CR=1 FL=1
MKLIRFHKDQDWGQDYYLQVLYTKRLAFFQGCVSWCVYPSWPLLQIQFGMGSLISISFQAYKFGLTIGLFECIWKL